MSAKGQKRTFRDSLDQFVSALLEVKRNVESERLGSLEIDRQLVLVRRLHWQIGWLLALEDMVNVTSRAAVLIDNIGSIGDQRRREGDPAIHWLRAQTRRSTEMHAI